MQFNADVMARMELPSGKSAGRPGAGGNGENRTDFQRLSGFLELRWEGLSAVIYPLAFLGATNFLEDTRLSRCSPSASLNVTNTTATRLKIQIIIAYTTDSSCVKLPDSFILPT